MQKTGNEWSSQRIPFKKSKKEKKPRSKCGTAKRGAPIALIEHPQNRRACTCDGCVRHGGLWTLHETHKEHLLCLKKRPDSR